MTDPPADGTQSSPAGPAPRDRHATDQTQLPTCGDCLSPRRPPGGRTPAPRSRRRGRIGWQSPVGADCCVGYDAGAVLTGPASCFTTGPAGAACVADQPGCGWAFCDCWVLLVCTEGGGAIWANDCAMAALFAPIPTIVAPAKIKFFISCSPPRNGGFQSLSGSPLRRGWSMVLFSMFSSTFCYASSA